MRNYRSGMLRAGEDVMATYATPYNMTQTGFDRRAVLESGSPIRPLPGYLPNPSRSFYILDSEALAKPLPVALFDLGEIVSEPLHDALEASALLGRK